MNTINDDEIIMDDDELLESNDMDVELTDESETIDESETQVGHIVVDYAKRLANEFRSDKLLEMLSEFAKDLVKSDRATIWMIDWDEEQLYTKVAQGLGGGLSELRIPLSAGAVGHSIANDERLVINDAYSSDLFNPEMDKKTGYKTECILVVPVKDQDGKIIGAVQTINKSNGLVQKYNNRDLSNLEIAGSYIATIIEKIITKYKDALLTKKMSQLNNVFDEHISFVVVDVDFRILKTSTAFQNIFDYKEDDVRDKNIEEIIVNEDRIKFKEGRVFLEENPEQNWSNEIEFIKRDEKPIWMNSVIHSDFEGEKKSGYTFLLDNITDKKLVEKYKIAELSNRSYDKQLLTFMGSVSSALLSKASRGTSVLTKTLLATVIILLTYANYAQLDELARADGKTIPVSALQSIQNLEGGIIKTIYVKEGDVVKKGDPLIQLSDITFLSQISENKIKNAELQAKLKRLDAESSGKKFDVASMGYGSDKNINLLQNISAAKQNIQHDVLEVEVNENFTQFDQHILASEYQLYISNIKEQKQKIDGMREQIKQKGNDLKDQRVKLKNLQKNFKMLQREIKVKRPLVAKRIFSQVELFKQERELNDMQAQITSIKESIKNTNSSIKEILNGIEEEKLVFKNSAKMEYNKTITEIATLNETQKSLRDKLNRTLIVSPLDGVVKEIFAKTIGGIMQSGKEVMSIIPSDDRLICEIKVKPEDIAKVYVGQNVHLKFSSYDSNLYGGLEGKVTFVSPDSTEDERAKKTYYIVHVKANKNFLGDDERYNKLKSGMIVNAEMVLGKKSILGFIFKPIFKDNYTSYTEN